MLSLWDESRLARLGLIDAGQVRDFCGRPPPSNTGQLLDERSGHYWQLNPTGAAILHGILLDQTSESVAQGLTEEYAIDLAVAGQDVAELRQQLLEAGLVVERTAP